jgi:hypothetical protein
MARLLSRKGYGVVEAAAEAVSQMGLPFQSRVIEADGEDCVVWETRDPLDLPSGDPSTLRVAASARGLRIDVMKWRQASADRLPALYAFCVGTNRDNPTAGLFVSHRLENQILSSASFHTLKPSQFEAIIVLDLLAEARANMRYFDLSLTEVFNGADPHASLAALPGRPVPQSRPEDVALLDSAIRAVREAGHPSAKRLSLTSAEFAFASREGLSAGTFLDIDGGQAYASSYVFNDPNAVVPTRRPKVAELLNRIAGEGVPFALALDLNTGLVRTRMFLPLTGSTLDPGPLLLGLLLQTHFGMVLYKPPIVAIARGDQSDPAVALAQHERHAALTVGA